MTCSAAGIRGGAGGRARCDLGAGVFALDGQWGTGKTTFLGMFVSHLRNEGFKVVEINAWETDFADDPLAALSAVLLAASPEIARNGLKEKFLELLRIVGPPAVRMGTSGLLSIDAVLEKGAGDMVARMAESGLQRLQDQAKSLGSVRQKLGELAEEIGGGKPLVVVVDELDRCRPTYAVEMLETIKHVFDVDGIVFVLAVNRRQLDQSAKTLYGELVDPESYFRRFFDVELRLPDQDREAMVRGVLRHYGLSQDGLVGKMFVEFLAASPHGIRGIMRTLQHYAVAEASLQRHDHNSWWWMLPTFILARLIDEERYRAFLVGGMSDAELADAIFGMSWTRTLRGSVSANIVEAALGTVWSEMTGGSSLLAQYERESDGVVSSAAPGPSTVRYWASQMSSNRLLGGRMDRLVAERVEMFDLRRVG